MSEQEHISECKFVDMNDHRIHTEEDWNNSVWYDPMFEVLDEVRYLDHRDSELSHFVLDVADLIQSHLTDKRGQTLIDLSRELLITNTQEAEDKLDVELMKLITNDVSYLTITSLLPLHSLFLCQEEYLDSVKCIVHTYLSLRMRPVICASNGLNVLTSEQDQQLNERWFQVRVEVNKQICELLRKYVPWSKVEEQRNK